MNVLFVHNNYIQPGGEEVAFANEKKLLETAGVVVNAFRVTSSRSLTAYWKTLSSSWGGGEMARLESEIRHKRPDIVHVYNLFPLLSYRIFRVCHTLKIPTYWSLFNYRPMCLNGLYLTPKGETCERCHVGDYFPGILRGCYRKSRIQSIWLAIQMARFSYELRHLVGAYSVPTEFLKSKLLQEKFPAEKIHVEPPFYTQWPELLDSSKPAEPYVLYIGRLSDEKGIKWLLEVFRATSKSLILKIIGKGPLESSIPKSHPRIHYQGFVSEIEKKKLIQEALAVVMPSDCFDNFPLVIPEVLSFGIPLVVSSKMALADTIQNKQWGHVFEHRNSESFWSCVDQLQLEPSGAGNRLNRQHLAQAYFSEEVFLEKRLNLYKSLTK